MKPNLVIMLSAGMQLHKTNTKLPKNHLESMK